MKTSKMLFLDWRHLQCGHLRWRTAAGQALGVSNPPEPPVPLFAEPQRVPHGIRLEAQQARTSGPVDGWKGWGRTIHDQGVFRSWHFEIHGHTKLGSGAAAHGTTYDDVCVCGVASDDGFAWRQVSRSPVRIGAQRGFDGVTFFVDPVAPAAERYKLVYCAHFSPGEHDGLVRAYLERPAHRRDARITWERRYGMYVMTSPDGVSWTGDDVPFMLHPSDTDTTVLWDPTLERYVMYTRMFREDRRWIGRAEAQDFREWGPVEPILWPSLAEPPDRDLYLNGHSFYPGMPEYQVMFPMEYHRFTERSDVRLCSSADGVAWNWVPGGPVIRPGRRSAWDSEFLGCGKDLMPFGAGRIATPYSGTPYPHKYPRFRQVWDAWNLGWAVWDEDRLCAAAADETGEFWTQATVPAGRQVRLNCRVPLGGQIRVGVEGVAGREAAACDPVVGVDGVHPITWAGRADHGAPEGQAVALHVQLRRAEVFAVSFA